MGKEEIVQQILSDAEKEAQEIIAQAEAKASVVREEAEQEAQRLLSEAQREVEIKGKAIADGKAATARLDSQKILLAEKRRVIAEVYARALEKLLSLPERDSLSLMEKLVSRYAEEGDEVVLSSSFRYRAAFEKLPAVVKKKLKVVSETGIEGGLLLRGKNSDVDLSFAALLAQDKEEHQSEIAAAVFKS